MTKEPDERTIKNVSVNTIYLFVFTLSGIFLINIY